jgi:hypothetical protein
MQTTSDTAEQAAFEGLVSEAQRTSGNVKLVLAATRELLKQKVALNPITVESILKALETCDTDKTGLLGALIFVRASGLQRMKETEMTMKLASATIQLQREELAKLLAENTTLKAMKE